MKAEVGDRVVVHGRHGTRIGVVVEGVEDGGSRVRWADGGESVLSASTEATQHRGQATWNAAKSAPAVKWTRGVTAGVGREAALRQEKLAREAAAREQETVAAAAGEKRPTEHRPAAGE